MEWFVKITVNFVKFSSIVQEYSKQVFQSGDDDSKSTVQEILYLCTSTYMRAISPFMPYLSEELYQRLEPGADSVCVAQYPATDNVCI
jgi:valyl-tRNA synthetase